MATAAVEHILGPAGRQVMAAAIMISAFGCVNGLILAGARVYYASGARRALFRKAGTLEPRYHAPVFALALQGVVGDAADLERAVTATYWTMLSSPYCFSIS